jgi:hypothetical protein
MINVDYGTWVMDVQTLCLKHLGCTWDDLCGERQPLEDHYALGEQPKAFVLWWSEKYNLTWFDDQEHTDSYWAPFAP